jgi:phosphate-selective porin OprO/OprP
MKTLIQFLLLQPILCFAFYSVSAQDKISSKFGHGINLLAADSSFSMKFTVRVQSQYEGNLDLGTNEYTDGFQIRRARLKFSGFMYNPKVEYKVELALSNADIEGGAVPESGNVSNIVLDAYVLWHFSQKWSLVFGQKKLPGNRERVISSQQVQFVDRSNLNSKFNIDRDLGIQLLYNADHFNLIGALSMGEGRNMVIDNIGGYDYTLRGEYLPFGQFTHGGDYFESDLERESTPKLSVGVTYDFNDGASRERGQLGEFFSTTRDLVTVFADAHFKYRGFSSEAEYANKQAPEGPLVNDASGNAYYTGTGFNWQAGYLFKNNVEVAGRYTLVTPEAITKRNENTQYTLALSKYFTQHYFKLQTDVTLIREQTLEDALMYRLKLEFSL